MSKAGFGTVAKKTEAKTLPDRGARTAKHVESKAPKNLKDVKKVTKK